MKTALGHNQVVIHFMVQSKNRVKKVDLSAFGWVGGKVVPIPDSLLPLK